MLSRSLTRVVAAGAATLLLVACSGSDGSDPGADGGSGSPGSPGTSTSSDDEPPTAGGPTPYLPVPAGVVLTDPGSELEVGEQGTVAWHPDRRASAVGVLGVKVRRLVHADIRALANWQLDAAGRGSALYYVTVTVTNVGERDLSGARVPLYVLDASGAFVESSSFRTTFDPCPSAGLPDGFVTGEKTTLCQAYLVPRRRALAAVAFRPTATFNPVTWVGKVVEPGKRGRAHQPSSG